MVLKLATKFDEKMVNFLVLSQFFGKMKNASRQQKCPFTETDIEDAYGEEVSMFLHCHLRGYDRHGDGKFPDQGNGN